MEEFNVFHHKFLTWLEVNGYNVEEVKKMNDEKLQEIVKNPYYKALQRCRLGEQGTHAGRDTEMGGSLHQRYH